MATANFITLQAFVDAVNNLDRASIPAEVKRSLSKLRPMSLDKANHLHDIARMYLPLWEAYQAARLELCDDSDRNKGFIPKIDEIAERTSRELCNIVDNLSIQEVDLPPENRGTMGNTPENHGIMGNILRLFRLPRKQ